MTPRWLAELGDLVWPRLCAGCARPGTVLCPRCRGGAAVAVVDDLTAEPVGAPVLAAGAYREGLRRALIAFKERGRWELAGPLGALLRSAVDTLLAGRCPPGRARSPFAPPPWTGVLLVPVPSTAAARRARGEDHVRRLATAAGRARGVRPTVLLRAGAERADAAGLDVRERLATPGRYTARPPAAGRRAPPVVLVDDIVTTGATARDAVTALRRAGWPVLGVAVVAATPRARPRLPPGATTPSAVRERAALVARARQR